ncbi:MAG TPA: hypothetical protein VFK06_22575 [Candidatus Angelobacter sp.]|nr:hypothetical protein [Candidatus Angelobacter sp.]
MATPDNPTPVELENKAPKPAMPEETPAPKEQSMDIHPVHGPVHTVREFFVHLLIVTLGILIALSFEGLLEWRHHRSLVREARDNLALEIADNKKAIDDDLPRIAESEEALKHTISVVQNLKTPHYSPQGRLGSSLSLTSLHATAWDTANRSGAVSYMSYNEVRKYTELYGLQQVFLDVQHEAMAPIIELGGTATTIFSKDKKHISQQELDEIQRICNRSLVLEQTLENAAKQLSEAYHTGAEQ